VHKSRPQSNEEEWSWDWVGFRTRCLKEAYRLVSPAEAEDAVQEAMLRAWRRRSTCRDPEAPLPWLLEITRNEARRISDRSRRREEVGLEEVATTRVLDEPVERVPERLTVRAALADLPVEDRALLEMRYTRDLTHATLARHLGLPEGTVKVRLHRLRRRLQGALESGA
jgi:RNA polymerase sigma-70 factor (ECF subfamily)